MKLAIFGSLIGAKIRISAEQKCKMNITRHKMIFKIAPSCSTCRLFSRFMSKLVVKNSFAMLQFDVFCSAPAFWLFSTSLTSLTFSTSFNIFDVFNFFNVFNAFHCFYVFNNVVNFFSNFNVIFCYKTLSLYDFEKPNSNLRNLKDLNICTSKSLWSFTSSLIWPTHKSFNKNCNNIMVMKTYKVWHTKIFGSLWRQKMKQ